MNIGAEHYLEFIAKIRGRYLFDDKSIFSKLQSSGHNCVFCRKYKSRIYTPEKKTFNRYSVYECQSWMLKKTITCCKTQPPST